MPPNVPAHRPTRVLNPLSFQDPTAEQQFQSHYTAPRPAIHHAFAAAAVLALLAPALRPLTAALCCLPIAANTGGCKAVVNNMPTELSSGSHLLRTAVSLTPTLLCTLLPSSRGFSTVRHLLHAVGRVMFTLTLLSADYMRDTPVWQHRTFILHLLAAVSRCPLQMYWCGALATWLAASAVDLGGISPDCAQSVMCLFRSLQVMAASFTAASAASHPVLQARRVAAVLSSSSSLSHLADAVVPGLLALHLERRSRRAWLAQQQGQNEPGSDSRACHSRGHCSAAAAVDGPYAGTICIQPAQKMDAAATEKQLSTGPPVAAAAGVQPYADGLGRLEYISLLWRQVYAFKFSHPPAAGPEDYQLLQQKVVAAMQAHLGSAQHPGAGDSSSSDIGSTSVDCSSAAIVTKCLSFRGCWQLVMDVVTTKAAAAATAGGVTQQQQHFEALIESVLQDLPGWSFAAWQELQTNTAAAADDEARISEPAAMAAAFKPTAAGIYISPVALCHTDSTAPTESQAVPASSSSSSSTAPASRTAEVKVHVPGVLVHQFVASHHKSLRVVVAQQAGSVVLLDESWDLEDSLPAAEDDTVIFDVCVPDISAAAEPLGPAAVEETAATMYDAFSLVIILDNSSTAAPLPATAVESSQAAPAAPGGAGLAVRWAVLAQLPLLLLPAAAQQELQELFMAAVDQGCQPCEAYQMLLPLLQDWALLLLDARGSSSGPGGAAGGGSSAVMQLQRNLACDALLSYFDSAVCLQCYKLVSQHKQEIQQQQQQAVVQGSGPDEEDPPGSAALPPCAAAAPDNKGSSRGADGGNADGGTTAGRSGQGPSVTGRSVCLGSPCLALWNAYSTYNSVALRRHGGVVELLYLFGVLVALGRAVTLLASSPAAAATEYRDKQETLAGWPSGLV